MVPGHCNKTRDSSASKSSSNGEIRTSSLSNTFDRSVAELKRGGHIPRRCSSLAAVLEALVSSPAALEYGCMPSKKRLNRASLDRLLELDVQLKVWRPGGGSALSLKAHVGQVLQTRVRSNVQPVLRSRQRGNQSSRRVVDGDHEPTRSGRHMDVLDRI